MNIIGGEFEDMQKTKDFLKKIYTLILLIALILCLSFSIRTGYCGELQNNKALDEKVTNKDFEVVIASKFTVAILIFITI
jgi:hypothetical protein